MVRSAVQMISGIIKVPKTEVILLLEAGYLLMQMGKNQEALIVFSGVASLVPHSDVPCIALGNLYFGQGNFNQALKEHQRALKRNPKSALAQAHIGEVLLFQQKLSEGVAALKKTIEMDPKGLPANFARELLKAKDTHLFDKGVKLKK
jgi:tetratricopeptide (TPR) repeat protein